MGKTEPERNLNFIMTNPIKCEMRDARCEMRPALNVPIAFPRSKPSSAAGACLLHKQSLLRRFFSYLTFAEGACRKPIGRLRISSSSISFSFDMKIYQLLNLISFCLILFFNHFYRNIQHLILGHFLKLQLGFSRNPLLDY
jgi:hypothetical protein